MKSVDLKVGDLAYVTDYPMRKMVMKLEPHHFVRSLVLVEPIPITLKFIENNFKKLYPGKYTWSLGNDLVNILAIAGCFYLECCSLDKQIIERVKYVHEIQRRFDELSINKELCIE